MSAQESQPIAQPQTSPVLRMMRRLYRLATTEHRVEAWYQWPSDKPCPPPDPQVQVYRQGQLPPADVLFTLRRWMGRLSCAIFLRRVKAGMGYFLTISEDGDLGGYTLIADMSCFHKYRQIASGGWMIGPCFTSSAKRRRGYYSRMLNHALNFTIGSDHRPAFIFASETNTASRRGIERVGFAPLGVYRTTLRFAQLFSSSRLLPDHPPLASEKTP